MQNNKLEKTILWLLIIALLQPQITLAQTQPQTIELQFGSNGSNISNTGKPVITPTPTQQNNQQPVEAQTATSAQPTETSKKLTEIRSKLRNESQSLQKTAQDISVLEQKLNEASERAESLEEQLKRLDEIIELNHTKIEFLEKQIASLVKEIAELSGKIKDKNKEISSQKAKLEKYLEMLYSYNLEIGSFESSTSQSIKLLFADDDASILLTDLYYLELLEEGRRRIVENLMDLKAELTSQKKELTEKKNTQQVAQAELLKEQQILIVQKEGKESLLRDTRGEEAIYQDLISASRSTQSKLRQEISALQGNYSEIIEKLGPDSDEREFGPLPGDQKLSWPIDPAKGISAFFRDPSYKAALGLEHNAVDIRANMGTTLTAPADGIVYKTKGGEGNDYHYIVIAHRDGIMTLYGHVYEILVETGDEVKEGQIIGLSGGSPGTRGAGPLTTGPHLHFEVFKDGRHVDPMLYLDLSQIDSKMVPDKYK